MLGKVCLIILANDEQSAFISAHGGRNGVLSVSLQDPVMSSMSVEGKGLTVLHIACGLASVFDSPFAGHLHLRWLD